MDLKILIYFTVLSLSNVFAMNKSDGIDYLHYFGYMNEKDESNFDECLKKFQKFASIKTTGLLDDETVKMMDMYRCGCSDKSKMRVKRFSIQGSKWRITDIKYKINYPEDLQHLIHSSVYRAFNEWAKHIDLSFSEVEQSRDALLHISFRPMDKEKIFGMAQYPIFGGNINFNENLDWSNKSIADLYQIALHEIGHTLGLGHSMDKNSIMYPFYNPTESKCLVNDDIEAH
ncbi:matrix metalloproteinase-18-like isoform X2 [Onthophagus taurus]|uniref:matrix metalloproteinase-18-like isoform X2 n=1 Tax=Onthophagus taurus TaxID=166361 RepID=UPI000C202C92|nr:matrix metalloproteinase-18-like isoform X2 [Onthophagus taurus]